MNPIEKSKFQLLAWTLSALALQGLQFAVAEDLPQRIVFIGDSITDGHTYLLMVQASLEEAGKTVPICINAGVAGDTAKGMLARLDRDVLIHRPTLVTLSAGINDVLRGVSTEDYARDMRAIAERMQKEEIPLVILTPSILGPKHAAAQQKLTDYISAIRDIAGAYHCRVAEVHSAMQSAADKGESVLGADQVHLSLAGYKHFTRALLDALGYKDIRVVSKVKYETMQGVIRDWKVRPATKAEMELHDSQLASTLTAGDWQEISLPFMGPEEEWWMDQERQRGFAVSLGRRVAPANRFLAKTVVAADSTHKSYLNVGAQVEKVWLNGKLVYESQGWTGWHAGKERISVTFDQGENILFLISGDTYFLSITDTNDW